jgi:hypothetical protein
VAAAPAGPVAPAGTPAAAGAGDDPLLLWVLPLGGAAGMATLLGLVSAAARRRRTA